MVLAFAAPVSQDLTLFTRRMWQLRQAHRVLMTDKAQEVWAPSAAEAARLQAFYTAWCEGASLDSLSVASEPEGALTNLELRAIPLTLALILLSLGVSLLIEFGAQRDLMQWLTIVDFHHTGKQVMYPSLDYTFSQGQWWRFITPAFMHFNLPHILFNLLWVWVIGRQIELVHGTRWLAVIFLVAALSSNAAQFWASGPFFGGMSGVVFAVLGYAWLWDRLSTVRRIELPPALMGFMLFWLVLGFSGGLEIVGLGAIANTAHLVGLLAGLAVAFVHSLLAQRKRG